MPAANYKCPRCRHDRYETGELRAAGGFWSKIFDIQSQKFTTVTCQQCHHTDLYKADTKMLENIFDLFTN